MPHRSPLSPRIPPPDDRGQPPARQPRRPRWLNPAFIALAALAAGAVVLVVGMRVGDAWLPFSPFIGVGLMTFGILSLLRAAADAIGRRGRRRP